MAEEQKTEEKNGKIITQPSQRPKWVQTTGRIMKAIGIFGLAFYTIAVLYAAIVTMKSSYDSPDSGALGYTLMFGLILLAFPSLVLFFLGSHILGGKKEKKKGVIIFHWIFDIILIILFTILLRNNLIFVFLVWVLGFGDLYLLNRRSS